MYLSLFTMKRLSDTVSVSYTLFFIIILILPVQASPTIYFPELHLVQAVASALHSAQSLKEVSDKNYKCFNYIRIGI